MELIKFFCVYYKMPGTIEGLECEQNRQGSWSHGVYVPMSKQRKYTNKLGVNINSGKDKSYEENRTSAMG